MEMDWVRPCSQLKVSVVKFEGIFFQFFFVMEFSWMCHSFFNLYYYYTH